MTIDPRTDQIDDVGFISDCGIVILAGGRSQRMGRDKSQLLLSDDRTFLETMVAAARQITQHTVVCVGHGQLGRYQQQFKMHPDFEQVNWAVDTVLDQGPLEGIHVGLKKLKTDGVPFAFVTGCDVPVLNPALIQRLLGRLMEGGTDATAPRDGQRIYAMTAVYRTQAWAVAKRLVDEKRLRASTLITELNSELVDVAALRDVDPNLDSLSNINRAGDYFEFLERQRIKITEKMRRQFLER